jgi:hypothetical protein
MDTPKEFSRAVHLMAVEYSLYFAGGLNGIDRKIQNRLNEIEDKIREMGIDWNDWTELVLDKFGGRE